MKEEWKEIDGFPGYQISNKGRVKSFINNRHGIGSKSHILTNTTSSRGYESVCLGRNNRRSVHRLVATAFIPNPDNLPMVRHMDDNPKNNHVSNLAWGTQVDNMQDCVKHGRLVGDTRTAIESRKKKVIATSLDGEKQLEFPSAKEASKILGVWPQHITHVVQGKIKQTGGWTFKYMNKEAISNE